MEREFGVFFSGILRFEMRIFVMGTLIWGNLIWITWSIDKKILKPTHTPTPTNHRHLKPKRSRKRLKFLGE